MGKQLTYYYVEQKFKDRGYILLSNEYINSHEFLKYQCPKGHVNSIRYYDFHNGRGCPECKKLKMIGTKYGYKHGMSYNLAWKREQNKLRHEKYPWEYSYNAAKARCNNPKNSHYSAYGKRGIKFLITKEEYMILWERDKAYLLKQPSIDRIDINGNYTFDNCRFIEHRENSRNNRKTMKVEQYSLDGKLLKIWNSQSEIKRELGFNQSHIGFLINQEPHIGYNFIWRKHNV